MELLFNIFLALHIAGGTLGLITGTISLATRKGDKRHRAIGKLFSYGMLTAGGSAFVLSVLHPNYFLFIVGVFTIYMVSTGYRYIYLKLLGKDQKPQLLDWILTISMALIGALFIVLGGYKLIEHNNFGIVFIVFGALSLRFVKVDIDNYRGNVKAKNYWLLCHLQRMIGGYIAAATAFLVVNSKYIPMLPPVVIWLLPTAALVPLIIRWSKKYTLKN